MEASDKGYYNNQELLENEYETSAIEEHGKSSSKIHLRKETVDESHDESDATSESERNPKEETWNLKPIKQHFVVDFQELQKYLTMVAVESAVTWGNPAQAWKHNHPEKNSYIFFSKNPTLNKFPVLS